MTTLSELLYSNKNGTFYVCGPEDDHTRSMMTYMKHVFPSCTILYKKCPNHKIIFQNKTDKVELGNYWSFRSSIQHMMHPKIMSYPKIYLEGCISINVFKYHKMKFFLLGELHDELDMRRSAFFETNMCLSVPNVRITTFIRDAHHFLRNSLVKVFIEQDLPYHNMTEEGPRIPKNERLSMLFDKNLLKFITGICPKYKKSQECPNLQIHLIDVRGHDTSVMHPFTTIYDNNNITNDDLKKMCKCLKRFFKEILIHTKIWKQIAGIKDKRIKDAVMKWFEKEKQWIESKLTRAEQPDVIFASPEDVWIVILSFFMDAYTLGRVFKNVDPNTEQTVMIVAGEYHTNEYKIFFQDILSNTQLLYSKEKWKQTKERMCVEITDIYKKYRFWK